MITTAAERLQGLFDDRRSDEGEIRRLSRFTRFQVSADNDALVACNSQQARGAEATVPPAPTENLRERMYRHRQKMSRLHDRIIEELRAKKR